MFKKYMHIERLGSDTVEGILDGDGECYIFPKIDGTNASVWIEGGQLCAGSRNRKLSLEKDNAGFYAWVLDHKEKFMPFFEANPDLRLYGEWLVPHTLKTYREDAWRQFYVFDVYHDGTDKYLPYPLYKDELEKFGIEYIAPLEIVTNPSETHLIRKLDANTYLIADGKGLGEGIVIKRYDFVNSWGDVVWAKIVRTSFKERHSKVMGAPEVMMSSLEYNVAHKYATRGRVEKLLSKMRVEGPVERRRIPEFLGRIYHDVVTEEIWEIVQDNNLPKLDFKSLKNHIYNCAKSNCPELF